MATKTDRLAALWRTRRKRKIKANTLHKLSKQAESWMECMRVELRKQAGRLMDEYERV
jgi:hypothetical protein